MTITLRDYQQAAIDWLYARRDGLAVVPAGGGKTLIAAASLARRIEERNPTIRPNVVIAVNTIEQCQQFEQALTAYPICHDRCNIRVACMAGLNPEDMAGCHLLIVDECHHGPSQTWKAVINAAKFAGAAVWGMTATPDKGDPDHTLAMMQLFGERYQVRREILVQRGHLARCKVRMLTCPDDAAVSDAIAATVKRRCKQHADANRWLWADPDRAKEQEQRIIWQAVQELGLVGNDGRNQIAVDAINTAVNAGGSVLVLVSQIKHAERLRDMLGVTADICTAKIGRKRRKAMIAGAREGVIRCMIATSLADEGLDVPAFDTLFLVNAGRSASKLEQRTGRILRPAPGKDYGMVYDFDDRCHYMLAAQAKARLRLYRKLGYDVI